MADRFELGPLTNRASRRLGASPEAQAALNRVDAYAPNSDLGTSTAQVKGKDVRLVTLIVDDSPSIGERLKPSQNQREFRPSTPTSSLYGSLALRRESPGPSMFGGLMRRITSLAPQADQLARRVQEPAYLARPETNQHAVMIGHRAILHSLRQVEGMEILLSTTFLNGGELHSYRPLKDAIALTDENYHLRGGTPLFDKGVAALRKVMAKTQEAEENWKRARTITCFITDGADNSHEQTAADIAAVVTMLRNKGPHIINAMGIDDGMTDYKEVFQSMGILPDWILTPGSTSGEIMDAFTKLAQASVEASRVGDQAFRELATGGFKALPAPKD
jgi:hypothetical protein